ncbi:hypothetical protein ACXYMO_12530 [Arenibacterium sp. CAU 1754]
MASGYSLKDQLFNLEKVRYLAGLFDGAVKPAAFESQVMSRLGELELKERIAWIAACLADHLPGDLPQAAPILRAALPPPLDPGKTDNDFGDFIFAPLGEFVVNAGLEDHPHLSLDLIEEITQRFTMEWAIRPFLNRWPDLVMDRLGHWVEHDNYHVRRLASEGTRPRLPWGQSVGLALDDPLPLLDVLHADRARFVTRSVANHLNDISKKNPDLAMDRLSMWHRADRQSRKELDWITGHALRGLVKAGHPRALSMLGYDPEADLDCAITLASDKVRIDDMLELNVKITAAQETPVLVDYVLWFHKADGGQKSKVFKMKQSLARAGVPMNLKKSHRMKGDATTFRLWPGPHAVEVQVNGKIRARAGFTLLPAPR